MILIGNCQRFSEIVQRWSKICQRLLTYFQRLFKDVQTFFKDDFRDVSKMFQRCSRDISKMFQRCSEILRDFARFVRDRSKMCQRFQRLCRDLPKIFRNVSKVVQHKIRPNIHRAIKHINCHYDLWCFWKWCWFTIVTHGIFETWCSIPIVFITVNWCKFQKHYVLQWKIGFLIKNKDIRLSEGHVFHCKL